MYRQSSKLSPIKHPEKVGRLDFLALPSHNFTRTCRELEVWNDLVIETRGDAGGKHGPAQEQKERG